MWLFISCLLILSCLPHTIADASAATGIHKVADPQQQQLGSVTLELKNRDMDIKVHDTYTYASVDVPPEKYHVTSFEPRADMGTVHHMLLYGCTVPTGGLPPTRHCTGKSLMFGWGKNAPAIQLPEGVGFRTGDDDDSFSSLLLELHYLVAPQTTDPDETSGLVVHLSPGIPKYTAGIMFFGSSLDLRPGLPEQLVEVQCCYNGPRPLTAMGVRVHAHDHSRSIWLDRLAGGDKPVRLHTGDPGLPQTFVPVAKPFVIQPGDSLRATCMYDTTNEKRHIYSGSTASHEMCNLYLMLYADAPQNFDCNNRGSGTSAGIRSGASKMGPLRLVDPPGSDRTWPISIGQISGMQVAPDGTKVWISHGGDRLIGTENHNEAIAVDKIACLNLLTGRIDRSFGDGHDFNPQGLTLGPDGAVWVVDAALRRVLQYSTEGELQQEFGPKFESGKDTYSAELCRPTDVAVMEDGSFYVSDGHCNRVTQFNAEGKRVTDLTLKEGNATFDPHDLAVYSCRGEVAVADRKNKRVIIFEMSSGRHSSTVDLSKYGQVYGLTVLRSTDISMAGYYALCWDDDAHTSAIVAIPPGKRSQDTLVLAWDIDSDEMDISAPQRINALAGKVGGSSSWGMGVNFFVADASTRGGGEDFKRLWLGRDSSMDLVIDSVQEEEHIAQEERANEDNGKEDGESNKKEHKDTISKQVGTNEKAQEGAIIDPHEVSQKHTIGTDEFINSETSKIWGQEGNSDKEDVKMPIHDIDNVTLSANHLDYRTTQEGYMQYGRFMMTAVAVASLMFGGLCCLCSAKNRFRYQSVQVESSDEANEGVTYKDNPTEGRGNLGNEHFSIVSSTDDPEAN